MKKIFSLILVLFLGFGICAFTGCKKDTGYDIKNLSADYKNIASNLDVFTFNETSKQIEIDYSSFVDINNSDYNYLTSALTEAPYSYLNNYNTIFANSISFVNSYISDCARAENVDKTLRNTTKSNLDQLLVAMQKVELCTENFARELRFNFSGNNKTELYLSTFKYLVNSYAELYSSVYDLTISLSRIYYNYLLKNSNPDVFETPVENFEVYDVLVNLEGKAKYEISALSFGFYKTDLQNSLPESITDNSDFMDLEKYTEYTNKVRKISAPVSVDLYKEKLDGSTSLKTQFYNYSIELYNIQTCLNNDFEKFYKAKSATNHNEIVENYYYLLEQNYQALANILGLF